MNIISFIKEVKRPQEVNRRPVVGALRPLLSPVNLERNRRPRPRRQVQMNQMTIRNPKRKMIKRKTRERKVVRVARLKMKVIKMTRRKRRKTVIKKRAAVIAVKNLKRKITKVMEYYYLPRTHCYIVLLPLPGSAQCNGLRKE